MLTGVNGGEGGSVSFSSDGDGLTSISDKRNLFSGASLSGWCLLGVPKGPFVALFLVD